MNNEECLYIIEPLEAQKDIKKVLDHIVEIVSKSEMSEKFLGLFLGGGFGRGEGSVIKRNFDYVTSNDYDLFAVVTEKINDSRKRALEEKLEKELSLKDCSIDIINIYKLEEHVKSGMLSQSLFDFLKGNRCLWVNEDRRRELAAFDDMVNRSYYITTSSAYDVLRTRMWCVCAPFAFDYENITVDREYKSEEFAYYQLIKAATAIIDSILIVEQRYASPKFKDKLDEFKRSRFSETNNVQILCELIEDKIYNRNNLSKINSDVIEYVINMYYKAVIYVKKSNRFKYYRYLLYDVMRLFYTKYIKGISCSANYSLNIIYIIKNRKSNLNKIEKIQTTMRARY